MVKSMSVVRWVVAVLVVALLSVGTVLAGKARAVETCHKINAKAVGQILDFEEGITESRIIGGGLLRGTTMADLDINPPDEFGVSTYDGILVLTNKHGTATFYIFDGVFDLVTGEFSNDSVIIDGTGRFEGATGGLFFHGFVFEDGSFIDDVLRGEVCLDRP